MNRKHRLTSSADFKRVRRTGKPMAHPLFVIITAPNQVGETRYGVMAGKAVGNAVQRNRAKRRLRAALRSWVDRVTPGWDVICVARAALIQAEWGEIQQALRTSFRRAGILALDQPNEVEG